MYETSIEEEERIFKMDIDDVEEVELKPKGLCGLTNIGNTCYMNSALQALSNCPQLTQFFLKCDEFIRIADQDKPIIAVSYRNLIHQIWDGKRPKYLTPTALSRAIKIHNPAFRGYYQQDTQEFLRCLMDKLHEELKRPIYDMKTAETSEVYGNECTLLRQKKLLGGNGSSDDSLEEEMDTEEYSNQGSPEQAGKKEGPKKQKAPQKNKSDSASKIEASKKVPKEPEYHSIITDLFDGKLLSSVQCLTCNRKSNRIETFQDLSLPIPGKEDISRRQRQVLQSGSATVPYADTGWIYSFLEWMRSWFVGPEILLQDCLAAFFTSDELQGDNMYNCEKCKKLRNGVKFSKVQSLPEILCIHLKRFRHEMYYSSKINTFVSFPLSGLQMDSFLSKEKSTPQSIPCTYNLAAVITHFGGVGAGHYIAYAKNCVNNKWYEFNDSCVTEVSESRVTNTEAYVLFYCKSSSEADFFRRDILRKNQTLPVHSKNCVYVSKEWFTRLETCVDPGPISNSDLLCQHGDVSMENWENIRSMVVQLARPIWELLVKRFGGGPELYTLKPCQKCKDIEKRQHRELETFSRLHEEFEELAEESQAGYHLSMDWYNKWYGFAKGKTQEPPGEIENTDLIEDFQKLSVKEDANFGIISSETWKFLINIYGGGPSLPFDKRKPVDEELRGSSTSTHS